MKANPTATLMAGLFVMVVTVGAYIYCEANGLESGPILAITGPVVAALLIQQSVARVEAKTDQAVANTNGALSGGIRAAVNAELVAAGLIPPTADPNAQASTRVDLTAPRGQVDTDR